MDKPPLPYDIPISISVGNDLCVVPFCKEKAGGNPPAICVSYRKNQ